MHATWSRGGGEEEDHRGGSIASCDGEEIVEEAIWIGTRIETERPWMRVGVDLTPLAPIRESQSLLEAEQAVASRREARERISTEECQIFEKISKF
jgi:hypothetical protein